VVNISSAIVATLLTVKLAAHFHFSESWSLFIEVVVVTFILLIFGEITPKVLAVKNPVRFARQVVFLINLVYLALYPVSAALEQFTIYFSRLFRLKQGEHFLSEDELKALIELGEEKGTIQEEEKEMIDSIFEFGETTVREIMVPRIDMVCVEVTTDLDDLVKKIQEAGHSRIPVYQERIDNIVGIIHAKDLIPYLLNSHKPKNLKELARPAYFVPESKKIDELLREFQQEKTHMAIVVDEYGGTAGLVTLEDVIEEIVGEIQDEYDKEQPLVRKIGENIWAVDARIDIAEFNETLPEPIPEDEDYESLGGFLFSVTGSVPEERETISYGPYTFQVEKLEGQRIVNVKVIYRPPEEKDEE
jgi:CBS domain containing-hemolysin-like protein